MDKATNPYAPGAGNQPPELAGRDEVLEEAKVCIRRVQSGRHAKSFIFIGLRGVGKTVLLNRVAAIAEEHGCKTVHVEAHDGKKLPELMVHDLRKVLLSLNRMAKATDTTKRALRALANFAKSFKVKIGDIDVGVDFAGGGEASSGDLEGDLTDLFLAVGEAAKSRKMAVVLTIDELQYLKEKELSALIMAVHRISQKGLPIVVVGAGLPQLVGQMGNSKSYAERLFNFPKIGALGPVDARIALQQPAGRESVQFTSHAIDEILRVTDGYPYFLQEWGYHAWNVAAESPIKEVDAKAATPLAMKSLDESFFRVRFDRLTPREKDYLRAMAELGPGPHRSGDIADRLGVQVESIAPLRTKLIIKGMIYSPQHGDTAFTVPLFDQFMKRAMAVPKKKAEKVRKDR